MVVAIGGSGSERLVHCSDLMEKTKEGNRQLGWSVNSIGEYDEASPLMATSVPSMEGLMISSSEGMVWLAAVVRVRANEENGEWGEVSRDKERVKWEWEWEQRHEREKKLLKN